MKRVLILLFGFIYFMECQNFVDVFNKGERGYYCIKIPDILVTKNNTIIAFGEARMNSCSDFTWTDLVYKKSYDGGNTWTNLTVLYSNSSQTDKNVIGNAAPVQLRENNRILVPFCRNNFEVWLTYSDDDGVTWSKPYQIENVTLPNWQWIGTGPPSSIQLSTGRIITPSYHDDNNHKDDADFSEGHIMYSDDLGKTWHIGGFIEDLNFPNECQAVELKNGSLLVNSRTLGTKRLKSISNDGGNHFVHISDFNDIYGPFGGCEGSTIMSENGTMYFSNPFDKSFLRFNMSIHYSTDEGNNWNYYKTINPGRSGYSALSFLPNKRLGLLFERSNQTILDFVFVPDHISFVIV